MGIRHLLKDNYYDTDNDVKEKTQKDKNTNNEYRMKYEVYLDKKEQKIIGIKKEFESFTNKDIFFDLSGKKSEFDRKKHFRIIFYSKISPYEFDYDNDNITMIINKLFEGMSVSALELIYEIKFER